MQEIWKPIDGYEEIYQVSNTGKIKSMFFISNLTHEKYYREKVIKPRISKKDKCARVELWKENKHKTFLVHRLVANAFLEPLINSKMTVNHKDGNRLNNNLENLEWLSRADNIRYGFEKGQYPQAKLDKVYFRRQICGMK